MTLSARTRLNAVRGLRPANFSHRKRAARLTAPAGSVIPFPSTQAGRAPYILMVSFVSTDGRMVQAIGGGSTLAAAVAFAQDSCPTDATWQPTTWTDLYGD